MSRRQAWEELQKKDPSERYSEDERRRQRQVEAEVREQNRRDQEERRRQEEQLRQIKANEEWLKNNKPKSIYDPEERERQRSKKW